MNNPCYFFVLGHFAYNLALFFNLIYNKKIPTKTNSKRASTPLMEGIINSNFCKVAHKHNKKEKVITTCCNNLLSIKFLIELS